jgi:hypothetical protein
MPDNFAEMPSFDVVAAQRRVVNEISQGSRPTTLLFLLTSALATAAVASLGLTEKGLPPRTQIAFAALTAIGAAWSAFFGWVLTRRKPLYAYHRVIAGRLALAATGIFTTGALTLASLFPELQKMGFTAAALGAAMMLAAGLLLWTAKRRHRDLLQLRGWLESQLGGEAPAG